MSRRQEPTKFDIVFVWQLRWLLATVGDSIRTNIRANLYGDRLG